MDATRYRGRLELRNGTIWIAGRNKTSLLRQAEKQAAAIAALLEEMPGLAMPVAPALCFVGTELPKHHLVVEGVHVVTRRGLKKMLGKAAGPHGQDLVTQTAAFLDDRLKLAGKSSFTATAEARTAG